MTAITRPTGVRCRHVDIRSILPPVLVFLILTAHDGLRAPALPARAADAALPAAIEKLARQAALVGRGRCKPVVTTL
jgi:hypothetical protein